MSTIAPFFPTLLEIITGGFALGIQTCYLHRKKISLQYSIAIAMMTIPALVLSLESMNSFLTCDESYIVYEPVDIINNPLQMWNLGAFRTTDLLVGIPLAGLKKMTGFPMDILAVIAKSMHWLLAFCMIIILINLLVHITGDKKFTGPYYLFSLYAYLLLPVMLLADKIINYDAFALLLGTIAILYLITGWRSRQSRYFMTSVITALFAAQEKLIASPILWICLCAGALRLSCSDNEGKAAIALPSVVNNSILLAVPVFSISIIAHLFVALINSKGQPLTTGFNLFYPLLTGFWPLMRAVGIDVMTLYRHPALQQPWFIPVCAAAIIAIYCSITLVLSLFYGLLRHAGKYVPRDFIAERYLDRTYYLFFIICFITGIISTYTIHAYLSPPYPVAPGTYVGYSFNKAAIYFSASSLLSHTMHYIGWGYAAFSNSIPSALGIIAIVNVCFFTRMTNRPTPGLATAGILALLAPLLYGLFQIPVGNRYLNIFIFIVVIKISIDFLRIALQVRVRTLCTIIFTIVLVAEITPFRPLFGAFRPIWSNYPPTYNTTFSKAILNPWWMGWGEEVFLAGNHIRKRLRDHNPNLSGVTLYHNYLGEWLFRKNGAVTILLDTATKVSYTENDFFILNRMGIAQSSSPLPLLPPPFYTITYRGFTSAWVFRGNDLAQHGVRFDYSGNCIATPRSK